MKIAWKLLEINQYNGPKWIISNTLNRKGNSFIKCPESIVNLEVLIVITPLNNNTSDIQKTKNFCLCHQQWKKKLCLFTWLPGTSGFCSSVRRRRCRQKIAWIFYAYIITHLYVCLICFFISLASLLLQHLCLWDILLWDILLWDILLQLYTSINSLHKPLTKLVWNTLSKKYVNKYF